MSLHHCDEKPIFRNYKTFRPCLNTKRLNDWQTNFDFKPVWTPDSLFASLGLRGDDQTGSSISIIQLFFSIMQEIYKYMIYNNRIDT